MNILIAYGTNSGNTYYTAGRIADVLRRAGHTVTVSSVDVLAPVALTQYDLVILGCCTWEKKTPEGAKEEGHLQHQMEAFLETLKGKKFLGTRFAVFGLGDSDYTYFCRAVEYLELFVKEAGGEKVGETLRIDSFPQQHNEQIDAWARSLAQIIGSSKIPLPKKGEEAR